MPAFVTVLACENSVDERVKEIVDTKKDLSDYVVDGKTTAVSAEFTDALRSIIMDL